MCSVPSCVNFNQFAQDILEHFAFAGGETDFLVLRKHVEQKYRNLNAAVKRDDADAAALAFSLGRKADLACAAGALNGVSGVRVIAM
jgi:hypothetical protein